MRNTSAERRKKRDVVNFCKGVFTDTVEFGFSSNSLLSVLKFQMCQVEQLIAFNTTFFRKQQDRYDKLFADLIQHYSITDKQRLIRARSLAWHKLQKSWNKEIQPYSLSVLWGIPTSVLLFHLLAKSFVSLMPLLAFDVLLAGYFTYNSWDVRFPIPESVSDILLEKDLQKRHEYLKQLKATFLPENMEFVIVNSKEEKNRPKVPTIPHEKSEGKSSMSPGFFSSSASAGIEKAPSSASPVTDMSQPPQRSAFQQDKAQRLRCYLAILPYDLDLFSSRINLTEPLGYPAQYDPTPHRESKSNLRPIRNSHFPNCFGIMHPSLNELEITFKFDQILQSGKMARAVGDQGVKLTDCSIMYDGQRCLGFELKAKGKHGDERVIGFMHPIQGNDITYNVIEFRAYVPQAHQGDNLEKSFQKLQAEIDSGSAKRADMDYQG